MSIDEKLIREIVRQELQQADNPTSSRKFWKPREVAKLFDIKDVETVRRWCKSGALDADKDEYSLQWLISNKAVEELKMNGGRPLRHPSSSPAA